MRIVNFEKRLRAFAVDTSLSFIILMLMALGFASIYPFNLYIGLVLHYLVLTVPYFFSKGKGQNFGKRTNGMMVINVKTGEVPNVWILVLREIVKETLVLFTMVIYAVVAAIISTGRKDGRTIHDFIFNTQVVAVKKPEDERYLNNTLGSAKENLKGTSYYD